MNEFQRLGKSCGALQATSLLFIRSRHSGNEPTDARASLSPLHTEYLFSPSELMRSHVIASSGTSLAPMRDSLTPLRKRFSPLEAEACTSKSRSTRHSLKSQRAGRNLAVVLFNAIPVGRHIQVLNPIPKTFTAKSHQSSTSNQAALQP